MTVPTDHAPGRELGKPPVGTVPRPSAPRGRGSGAGRTRRGRPTAAAGSAPRGSPDASLGPSRSLPPAPGPPRHTTPALSRPAGHCTVTVSAGHRASLPPSVTSEVEFVGGGLMTNGPNCPFPQTHEHRAVAGSGSSRTRGKARQPKGRALRMRRGRPRTAGVPAATRFSHTGLRQRPRAGTADPTPPACPHRARNRLKQHRGTQVGRCGGRARLLAGWGRVRSPSRWPPRHGRVWVSGTFKG